MLIVVLADFLRPGRLFKRKVGHSSKIPSLCKFNNNSTRFADFLLILREKKLKGQVISTFCSVIARIGPL